MNTEQIMALVDAYAEANKRYGLAASIAQQDRLYRAMEMAREKALKAIESLQNRDDWK